MTDILVEKMGHIAYTSCVTPFLIFYKSEGNRQQNSGQTQERNGRVEKKIKIKEVECQKNVRGPKGYCYIMLH